MYKFFGGIYMEEEKNKKNCNENTNKKEEKKSSSVVKVFIFLVIAVVCVGAYFGITKWYEDKSQNKNVEVKEEAEEITNEPLYTFEEFPKVLVFSFGDSEINFLSCGNSLDLSLKALIS